jgi:pilus assembly protein CpaB
MKKQYRTLIVLTVAVITAGLAAFGVMRVIQNMPVREVEVANTQVVVAAAGITMGERLGPQHLRVVAWPSRNPVEGSFSDPQEVLNRGVIAPIAENEPITERKLASLEAGAGLPPVIPEGMRAISVRVNDVVGVAGFVVPGTRVDLLVTVRDSNAAGEPMTRTVVSRVEVLTAGTKYDQEQSKDGVPIPTTVVTLAVTPEGAERIALASNEGQIALVLRNPLDIQDTETEGIRLKNLMSGPAPAPVIDPNLNRRIAPPRPAVPAPKPYMIETIKGGERETKELK